MAHYYEAIHMAVPILRQEVRFTLLKAAIAFPDALKRLHLTVKRRRARFTDEELVIRNFVAMLDVATTVPRVLNFI